MERDERAERNDERELRTDPDLLILIIAVGDYIRSRQETVNPFVKGFGETDNSNEAYEELVEAFVNCSRYYGEASALLDEIVTLIKQEDLPKEGEPRIE